MYTLAWGSGTPPNLVNSTLVCTWLPRRLEVVTCGGPAVGQGGDARVGTSHVEQGGRGHGSYRMQSGARCVDAAIDEGSVGGIAIPLQGVGTALSFACDIYAYAATPCDDGFHHHRLDCCRCPGDLRRLPSCERLAEV
ncbi:hypothetical protein H257_08262 [Aphanomyces astaci]|uniref:Uncharacterized protein n=1 Tax=Aphanomyces astaci TaxID=112090 RepID=W4GGI1_APHAT|nr:hypothetical protein H257_08262 [Aphanomyces astaci]ETV78048.1 hypothetical protein H257_08262 [Aphanomyces astaci]|eukprot:XP_009832385.1 hypothetical protein H257_08262 [Aphanomyces astaci]